MRSLLLFFALACTQACAVVAQQPDTVRSLFDRAHRGNWYLRARLADSTTMEGRVPRLQVDAATLGRASLSGLCEHDCGALEFVGAAAFGFGAGFALGAV